MTPTKQTLDARELQLVLDSAGNAAKNGRNQYFTPPAHAVALMLPLPPRHARALAVDLQCGDGALLRASGAKQIIGCDIDPKAVAECRKGLRDTDHILTADCTVLAALLAEAGCKFDLAFANPPFSMQWHRARLDFLAASSLPAVEQTFPARGEFVDSTLATLCILLDRLSRNGEGMMLCNPSTAERLINGTPLANHIWLWVTIPGGVFPGTDVETCALYFARDHVAGPQMRLQIPSAEPDVIAAYLAPLASQRSILRRGLAIHADFSCDDLTTLRHWNAAIGEHKQRQRPAESTEWNLWLGKDGTIRRHLTPFQAVSVRIPKADAKALDALQGQTPMSLVVQKPTRLALQRAVTSPYWKVSPELAAAVERALHEYHACRAPFYPLNDVQRLGWLDEEDMAMCAADLPSPKDGKPVFLAGRRYCMSTLTVETERNVERMNILGTPQDCTLHGRELVVLVRGEDGREWRFGDDTADFRWPAFLEHFRLPEVKDIAQIHPDTYAAHMAWLEEFEKTIT